MVLPDDDDVLLNFSNNNKNNGNNNISGKKNNNSNNKSSSKKKTNNNSNIPAAVTSSSCRNNNHKFNDNNSNKNNNNYSDNYTKRKRKTHSATPQSSRSGSRCEKRSVEKSVNRSDERSVKHSEQKSEKGSIEKSIDSSQESSEEGREERREGKSTERSVETSEERSQKASADRSIENSKESSEKSSSEISSNTSHSCISNKSNNSNNKHLHNTTELSNSNNKNSFSKPREFVINKTNSNNTNNNNNRQQEGSSDISSKDTNSTYNDSSDSKFYIQNRKLSWAEKSSNSSTTTTVSCCSNERLHEHKRRTTTSTTTSRRRHRRRNTTTHGCSSSHTTTSTTTTQTTTTELSSSSSRISTSTPATSPSHPSTECVRRSWSKYLIPSSALRVVALVAATTTTLPPLVRIQRGIYGLNKYSWIFLLIYLNLSAKFCIAGYHEKKLLHDLLDPYNTLERPVLNESDPLQLSFGLTLMQIIDVDEKNQLLVTNVWLKLEWNDMNLRWNTSDYGGVKDLRIPPHRIWKPDVLMYNSADEGFDGTYQTNVVVRSNGSCLYVPPGIFKSTCKIDITWFPFDDQRCEMKFGSWTYDGFQLDLQLQDETGGDISSYVLNGEWELLGVPGKRNEIYYNCCPEPYIDITFAIIIRRRTLYYFFNLIIPCVLIASMALLGFTLPPDSGEKLSLGVTILLSLTVFLNMVAETMPATSDAVPLLGTYFNCIMFMVASSVVSTILILNYHHRNANTHEMSEWIRLIFLCWLPWILRMSRPGRPLILEFPPTPCSDTSSERKHQILSDVELKERSSKSLLANVLDIDDDFRHNCRPMTPGGTLPHNTAFYRTVYGQGDDGSIGPIGSTRMPDAVTHHTCMRSSTEYELGLILKEIRFITDQLRKEDEDNDIANDWKFAAMVVDRLCLIIFTMFTILATIAVLLSAPHIIVS